MHYHKCKQCKTVWEHFNYQENNLNCPRCNVLHSGRFYYPNPQKLEILIYLKEDGRVEREGRQLRGVGMRNHFNPNAT